MEHKEKTNKDLAVDMAKSFLLSGLRIKDSDSGGLIADVQRIIDGSRKQISRAVKEFMSDADTDSFLLSLLPVHYRILYEAYAPYWLSHCKPVTDRDQDAEFTYYNDLIDMYWAAGWDEWKTKGRLQVTVMLPPTKGLMIKAYRDDTEQLRTMSHERSDR